MDQSVEGKNGEGAVSPEGEWSDTQKGEGAAPQQGEGAASVPEGGADPAWVPGQADPAARPTIHDPTAQAAAPRTRAGAAQSQSKPSPKERSEYYLWYARHLSKTIRTHKKINTSKSKLRGWANDIRKLVETDGVDEERLQKALDWYAEHAFGEFIPIIESGDALRRKFLNLEAAMEREQRPAQPKRRRGRKHVSSGAQPKPYKKYASSKDEVVH